MRSATSYFNGALYRKTLARFWPLWGLWGVGWLFLFPLRLLTWYFEVSGWHSNDPRQDLLREAINLPNMLSPGVLLALGFAVLCAMAVFGYLYNGRSACWTHALPVRREALFTTQYLAGLSFLLLPLLAVGILTAIIEVSFLPMGDWNMALSALLTWLLAQSGMCLFFFSFAAFCAMFTGHILALPAFYFILNGLAAGLWFLLDALMREFYYGYVSASSVWTMVQWLTPVAALEDAVGWEYRDGMELSSPGTVAVYALLGLILFSAALWVYRRRHVETAGDVVAVAIVRPVFKYGVSFCVGLSFGMFTAAFFNLYGSKTLTLCILVWAVIGCFAAEMLLKKSFRVLSAWKGAAVVAGVLLVICVVCFLDLFNIVGRVPAVNQVDSVDLDLWLGSPYDDGRRLDITLTDPEHIAMVTALHQAVVDNRDKDSGYFGDYTTVYLHYTLSNGGKLNRDYSSVPIYEADLEVPGTVACAFQAFLEDRELVRKAYGFDTFLEDAILTTARLRTVKQDGGVTSVYVNDFIQELWDAVQQDFDEGTIGLRFPFHENQKMVESLYQTSLIFGATDNAVVGRPGMEMTKPANYELEIYLTTNAKHTLAVLDKTGLWEEGYALYNWEDALQLGG